MGEFCTTRLAQFILLVYKTYKFLNFVLWDCSVQSRAVSMSKWMSASYPMAEFCVLHSSFNHNLYGWVYALQDLHSSFCMCTKCISQRTVYIGMIFLFSVWVKDSIMEEMIYVRVSWGSGSNFHLYFQLSLCTTKKHLACSQSKMHKQLLRYFSRHIFQLKICSTLVVRSHYSNAFSISGDCKDILAAQTQNRCCFHVTALLKWGWCIHSLWPTCKSFSRLELRWW